MRTFQLPRTISAIICILILAAPLSAGTFKDRDGATHAWTVDSGHTLVWEGAPYIPFGIEFQPKYLSVGQTDENWAADQQDIAAYKLAGVNDILIKPGKALTSIPAAALQKVIDELETNGLRYGLELDDPSYAPITGYVVQPINNRTDKIQDSGLVTHSFSDAKAAIYALCDTRTGQVRGSGREDVKDGQISVPVVLKTDGEHVMLFYPLKTIASGAENAGMFDVWSDFEQHRDRLLIYLKQIKFGKGFRFFADPFTDSIGPKGEVDCMVPTSNDFRFEYAAWLSRKYGTARDLSTAWGVLQHDVVTFDEAARLIPLWKDGRGAPLIYDDGLAHAYPADAAKSSVWADFLQFRAESVRGYMDAIADVLKRTSADVPMVFTANSLQPVFQPTGTVGYDGLISPSSGDTATTDEGRVLSLAESSARVMWTLARVAPEGNTFAKKQDLFSAMNAAHDLGAKGFIVSDIKGNAIEGANLVSWLAEYSSLSANDKSYATYRPKVVYFPDGVEGAKIRRLTSGAWWLPTLISGTKIFLGKSLGGYALDDTAHPEGNVCIWSTKGSQVIHLAAAVPVSILSASGIKTELKPKKGRVELTVGDEPLTVVGIPTDQFLPIEVAGESIQDLSKAIIRAEQKRMDAGDYKTKLKNAQDMLDRNQVTLSLNLTQEALAEINHRMRGLEHQ